MGENSGDWGERGENGVTAGENRVRRGEKIRCDALVFSTMQWLMNKSPRAQVQSAILENILLHLGQSRDDAP